MLCFQDCFLFVVVVVPKCNQFLYIDFIFNNFAGSSYCDNFSMTF